MAGPRGRIMIVHPNAERGGSDYCLLRMVRELSSMGWTCHVVTPSRSPLSTELLQAGAVLHVVPMRRITKSGSALYWLGYVAAWPIAVLRLMSIARRSRPTVVASNSLHSWYAWAVALLTRKPLVWHAREIVVQSSAALQLERWLCRHFADVVIAASRPVADQLAGSRVVVVHDVPDPTEFTPARAGKFRAVSGIPDDVPLIGSAGRIDTWKGFEILLDAVPSIQSVRKDAYFVIAGGAVAGKEAFASTLARRADQLENVYWMGERQDMPELLADLDVFVLASTEPEPFGSVLAEALAAGVPCVATDHGGSPEMLAQFSPEISRLVPPRDQKALAEAVLALLPAGASSPGSRRLRPAQIMSRKTTFDTVYAAVVRGPQDIEKLADI